jgi:hypothetical protein
MTNIINNVFRPKKHLKKTRIKLHNTPAIPTLQYGSENWTITAGDAKKVTAEEMEYVRRTAGCISIDHKMNTDIAKETKHNLSFIQNAVLQDKLNTICK